MSNESPNEPGLAPAIGAQQPGKSVPRRVGPRGGGSREASAADSRIFESGGEMGALMRSRDWSRSALGPISRWSHALKTMIGVLLRSQFPMHLSWGPSLVQLYNDAYRPILGAKHPRSMGQPVSECWPEIWHIMEPIFAGPLAGLPATGSEDLLLLFDRKGFLEETHFKAAYSPVPDETVAATGIGGVLATVAETTQQVFCERQLKTLREVAARAVDAKTPEQACAMAATTMGDNRADVPFALFYLLDAEGTEARLVASCGFGSGHGPANPAVIALGPDAGAVAGWDLERTARGREIELFQELAQRFGSLPSGSWGEPPRLAIALPLAAPDQPNPYGVLIAGVNPHRELNDGYQTFFELAAAQVVTAIHNARGHEQARVRAEKLAAVDRAKTAFFSNVSHEFRTPLALILGITGEALTGDDEAVSGEGLETVHRNALRLLKLVNTLLDFSRIEAGSALARPEPTDLSGFTAELASSFRSLIEKAGLTLTVDCPPLGAPVYVDRMMYEKVILNLLSNAFKFTLQGGICVSLRGGDRQVQLRVSDTGAGIPGAELPHLFERFYRVEGSRGRSYEGSGIGLSLVQELARLHGGDVHVESTVGQGSVFSVSLPLGDANLSGRCVDTSTRPATVTVAQDYVAEADGWLGEVSGQPLSAGHRATAGQRRPQGAHDGRILLADDNADMRAYVRRLLDGSYAVETVENGARALEAARARPPDLILSDVMMPALNGFDLLRELKADPRTAAVPVILLSARAGEEATVEGLQAGADDYLVKPFGARELVARVEGAVKGAKARAERERLLGEVEVGRSRLSSLFENAPAFVCTLRGPGHVFEIANPLFRSLVGRERTLIGLAAREAMPEMVDQGFIALLDGVYRTGTAFLGREARVRLDLRGDGVLVDAFVTFVYQPARDAQGTVEGIDVFGFEVTDHVRTRKEAEALADELRARVDLEQQLIGIVSHDLRSPMHAILLGSACLLSQQDLDDRSTRTVGRIQRAAERGARMIGDLLDFTQARLGGRIHVELRASQFHEVTRAVLDEVQATYPDREIRGEPIGDGRGEWDPDRLAQVVQNLVTNALKYSPRGTPVSVQTRDEGDRVTLTVHNEGAPISPQAVGRLFEPLQRAAEDVDPAGRSIGLGLYIVKHIVEAHDGTVSVESSAADGTTFHVRLPKHPQPGARSADRQGP